VIDSLRVIDLQRKEQEANACNEAVKVSLITSVLQCNKKTNELQIDLKQAEKERDSSRIEINNLRSQIQELKKEDGMLSADLGRKQSNKEIKDLIISILFSAITTHNIYQVIPQSNTRVLTKPLSCQRQVCGSTPSHMGIVLTSIPRL
jgi:chromosome segregation ATPase